MKHRCGNGQENEGGYNVARAIRQYVRRYSNFILIFGSYLNSSKYQKAGFIKTPTVIESTKEAVWRGTKRLNLYLIFNKRKKSRNFEILQKMMVYCN